MKNSYLRGMNNNFYFIKVIKTTTNKFLNQFL